MIPTPWWRVCAKAVVAGAAALTVAGGVILAAVADDHVTTTEWVTIALALAGAVASPAGVYAARNA